MLGIVLWILKIIGLALLVILGVFLAIVLLVLLVPVPYRLWVSGEKDALAWKVKIFGIQVFPKRERKKKKRNKNKKKTESGGENHFETQEPLKEPSAESVQPQTTSSDVTARTQGTRQEPAGAQPQLTKRQGRTKRKKEKEKHGGRGLGTLRLVWQELCDAGNHRALRHVFAEIKYLLKHLGPRRVHADVNFSLGDPANTGYATAALSICPFSYGKDCHIFPDFEAEQIYLRGWLDLRGHARALHVLIAGLRLLCDKDIRKVIKKLRNKKSQ